MSGTNTVVPRVLVLQHIDIEHPGILRDFMNADGIPWTAVELDQGESIPDPANFDVLVVMGGPMDVWEEQQYPWLMVEKAFIHEWVMTRGKPYLGLCLGHQLLADACGGQVGKAAEAEVGIMPVALTDAGRDVHLFRQIPGEVEVLQWHGAEVIALPHGAVALAASPACAVNAMAVGDCAFGLQFHLEMTASTVAEWAQVPAYAAALEAALGRGAVGRLEASCAQRLGQFQEHAKIIYDNFMAICQGELSLG